MTQKPVVIVTGAAAGIGRATALTFARKGYAVALVDMDAPGLEKLEAEFSLGHFNFLSLAGDLQESDFLRSLVEATRRKWGRIDVLINNAAWRTLETLRNISIENWEKTIRICLTAPAFLTKYVTTVMEELGTRGVIVNIGSIQSGRASGTSPAYSVCKGGLESLTFESAVLYGPKGIRVIAVNPGNTTTGMSTDYADNKSKNISEALNSRMNEHTPLDRAATPQEIANVCYWLSTAEASFITGTSIVVDGGFARNFNSYEMKKLQFPSEF